MQVSDEILLIAAKAYNQGHESGGGGLSGLRAAIQAILPHIRNEVLEEAAREAETDLVLLPVQPDETKIAYGKRVIAVISDAIRNLKVETEEAHNG